MLNIISGFILFVLGFLLIGLSDSLLKMRRNQINLEGSSPIKKSSIIIFASLGIISCILLGTLISSSL